MAVPTLTDAKTHLSLTGSSQDAELTMYLGAAQKAIERRVGPLSATAFTETFTTTGNSLVLSHRPVRSLTTLTAITGMLPFAVTDLYFDEFSGVVRRKDGGSVAGIYTLTYSAGLSAVPDNVFLAVLVTLRHNWNSKRGNTRRPADDDSYQSSSGVGYALPWQAIELLGDADIYQGVA